MTDLDLTKPTTRAALRELASTETQPYEGIAHAQDTPNSNVFDRESMGVLHAVFYGPDREKNAEFYVAAKKQIIALLDELDRLEKVAKAGNTLTYKAYKIACRLDDMVDLNAKHYGNQLCNALDEYEDAVSADQSTSGQNGE